MPSSSQANKPDSSATKHGAATPQRHQFWVSNFRKVGVFPVLVCLYGGYYLSDVWGDNFETMGYGLLCSILVFCFAALLAVRALVGGRGGDNANARDRLDPVALGVFGLLLIFVIAVEWIGFFYAVLPLSIALLWVMNYRRPLPVLAMAIGLTLLAYLVLDLTLGVPLPAAPWSS